MNYCTYPDCKCPFDHTGEMNWCARGLLKQEANNMSDEQESPEDREYRERAQNVARTSQLLAEQQVKFYTSAIQLNNREIDRPNISQANVWISAVFAMLNNSRLDLTTHEVLETADVILYEFNKRFDTTTGDPDPNSFTCDIFAEP